MEIELSKIFPLCEICLKAIHNSRLIILTTCGHRFHYSCVEVKTKQHLKCPCCETKSKYLNIMYEIIKTFEEINYAIYIRYKYRHTNKRYYLTFLFHVLGKILGVFEDIKKYCVKLLDSRSMIKMRQKFMVGLIWAKNEVFSHKQRCKRFQPILDSYLKRWEGVN